jgi:predicted nucleotidyltransferase
MAEVRAACPPWARNVILAGYRGSESHGTSLFEGDMATDDVDVFAITVQRPEWYVGLHGYTNSSRQAHQTAGARLDLMLYDVRKFFHLLAKGNPNVHVVLWLKPEHYIWNTIPGARIILNRRIFLSTSCLDALCGYATAQFKKMGTGQLYQGYMGAKRKMQVDRFGYDVKNAAHCIRLLLMGIELCTEGTLYSWRPESERAELMAVKRGEWSLETVKARADELWATYRKVEKHADLPEWPDYDAINALLVETIESANTPPCAEEAA